jgi:two-component system cell cycle sensor histidine kinase/response regulator CckA
MNTQSSHSETILLAEDQPDLRRLIAKSLQQAGYRVFAAEDGLKALEISRGYGAQLDLLITDMKMPRMDGEQLVEALRLERPGIRVLYMSGLATAAPSESFLQKPFIMRDLESLVRDLLPEQVFDPADKAMEMHLQ